MPLSYTELEQFYKGLVRRARRRKIPCAITSGMACVAFGVAQTTQDCDLLCAPDSAGKFLDLLGNMSLHGCLPSYRGHLTAPLDVRWLKGGWTSHFIWRVEDGEAFLDVFGVAPRGSTPWEAELNGFYAGLHTVAEMKRTNRDKDWSCVTILGAQMLEREDSRGWLHIYDEELLLTFSRAKAIPLKLQGQRPLLKLVGLEDSRLRAALHAERQFWHELDRVRLRIYAQAAKPYMLSVKKSHVPPDSPLARQHEVRVHCAEQHLSMNPLQDFGLDRMIGEAREALSRMVHPETLAWLPDVRPHFRMAEP